MISYRVVKTKEDRRLFAEIYQEYLKYLSTLGHDISTNPKLPSIDKELEENNFSFNRQIIALLNDDMPVGYIGLEKLGDSVCEMKRMFVLPTYRNKGTGEELTHLIIEEAKKMGYRSMKLSSLYTLICNSYLSKTGISGNTPIL